MHQLLCQLLQQVLSQLRWLVLLESCLVPTWQFAGISRQLIAIIIDLTFALRAASLYFR